MRALLLDVNTQEVKVVDVESDIHAWYKLLNCDLVEMPEYQIEGKYFTFICDEEGLLKNNPVISAVDSDNRPMLVGNVLICNSNYENGDVVDLTDEDINLIQRHVKSRLLIDANTGNIKSIVVIEGVEY